MKLFGIFMIFLSTLVVYQYTGSSSSLSPKEFQTALQKSPGALLLDVRSSKEFTAGHLSGAMNMDCSIQSYKGRVEELDTTLAVFIYCADGKQSKDVAAYFRSLGFVSITEMSGGIQRWQSEKLPTTPSEVVLPDELTLIEFSRFLNVEHYVLVDYYIPWDAHCQKMEPIIDELAIKYASKVKMIRINTDKYKWLATEQGITVLPTYKFYENGRLNLTLKGACKQSVLEKLLSDHEFASLGN